MKIRRPKNRFVRWVIYLGTPPILFLLVCFGIRWYTFRESAAELRAETDRLDAEEPGWDWDTYLKNRKPIADSDNSYTLLPKLMAVLDKQSSDAVPELNRWRIPPEPMPRQVSEWAGTFVVEQKAVIRIAREFDRFPEGRHPIKYSPDLIGTIIQSMANIRYFSWRIVWDCRVNAQLGRFDLCIRDIRAIRNAARSMGDEAFVIPFLIRCVVEIEAAGLVSETLGQGEITEAELALLQREFAEEVRQPYFRHALQTERAASLKSMEYYAGGNGSLRENIRFLEGIAGPGKSPDTTKRNIERYFLELRYPPVAAADQAHLLRRMNAAIGAAGLTGPQRLVRFGELADERRRDASSNEAGYRKLDCLISNLLIPFLEKGSDADLRWKAWLRTTVTGLAAERFRLIHKRWPNSLGELVPQFHDRIEEDPYTEAPLLFKKFEDGIAIYSVGTNGIDDGGDVNGKTQTAGLARGDYQHQPPTDIGIRLWDVEKRGRSVR